MLKTKKAGTIAATNSGTLAVLFNPVVTMPDVLPNANTSVPVTGVPSTSTNNQTQTVTTMPDTATPTTSTTDNTTTTPVAGTAPVTDTPIYMKWWFYAIVVAVCIGGFLAYKKFVK